MRRVITCTTRQPRSGEMQGVDYHFLEAQDFQDRVRSHEFLEHATVYGRSYGTLRSSVLEILDAGMDALLIIDVQGAASVRASAATDMRLSRSLVTVFLTPPTQSELEQRLRGRASESEESLRRRMESAAVEAARWNEFDYLVVSGNRDQDLRRIRSIYESETMRRDRQAFEFGH